LESMGLNKDFWRRRPTFVTGATGLVGGWLVRRLIEAEADVVCLVRDGVPQSELVRSGLVDKVKVVRGDALEEGLEQAIARWQKNKH